MCASMSLVQNNLVALRHLDYVNAAEQPDTMADSQNTA